MRYVWYLFRQQFQYTGLAVRKTIALVVEGMLVMPPQYCAGEVV